MRRAFAIAALGLLSVGVFLRVLSMVAFKPAILGTNDSVGYLGASLRGIFEDPVRPAGYPLFLRMVRWVSDSLPFTIALQHALGVASAVLLYLTVRRLGGGRWAALLPGAIVLLGADYVYLEHTLLSEALFLFLLACAAYAVARAVTDESVLWAALATGFFAASATVRTVAVFVVPLAVVWAALVLPRRRLVALGATAAVALAVALTYAVPQHDSIGSVGLGRAGGWSLYGRSAPFADCKKFDPPAGTEQLCEDSDPDDRRGGNWYAWQSSPARDLYGGPPNEDEIVGKFGRAAIKGQPLEYLEAVATDLIRYAAPGFNAKPDSGLLPETNRFPWSDPVAVPQVVASALPVYGEQRPRTGPGRRFLEAWSDVVAVHPAIVGLLILGGIAAVFVLRGVQRRAVLLLTRRVARDARGAGGDRRVLAPLRAAGGAAAGGGGGAFPKRGEPARAPRATAGAGAARGWRGRTSRTRSGSPAPGTSGRPRVASPRAARRSRAPPRCPPRCR